MKIALGLVLALVVDVYSNCGCLKCNQHLQVLKPRGTNTEIIFKYIPCPCSQSLPYRVQVPGSVVGSDGSIGGGSVNIGLLGLCGGIIGGGGSLPPKTYGYKVYEEISGTGSDGEVDVDEIPGGGQEYSLNIQIPVGKSASEFNPREIKARPKVDKVIFTGPLVDANRPGCPYPNLVVPGPRPQPGGKPGCSGAVYRPYYACPNRPRPVYQCSRYENTRSFAGIANDQDLTRESCNGCYNPICRCRRGQLETDMFFNYVRAAPRNKFIDLDETRWAGSCRGCTNLSCQCQNGNEEPAARNSFVGPRSSEEDPGLINQQRLVPVQTLSKMQNREHPNDVHVIQTRQGQFLLNIVQQPERVWPRQRLDDVLSMFSLGQGQTGCAQTCRVCSFSPCQCHTQRLSQLHFDQVETSPRENLIESRFLDLPSHSQNRQEIEQRCSRRASIPEPNFHRSYLKDFQNYDSLRKRFDDVMSYGSYQIPIKKSEICKICLLSPCRCSRKNLDNSRLHFVQTKTPPKPFSHDELGLRENYVYQKDGLQLFGNSVGSKSAKSLTLPAHQHGRNLADLQQNTRRPIDNQRRQNLLSNAPTRVNLMPNQFFEPQLDLPDQKNNILGYQDNMPGLQRPMSENFPRSNSHFGADIPLPKHEDQNVSKVYQFSLDDKKLPSRYTFIKSELFDGLSLPDHPNGLKNPENGLSGIKAINFALPPSFYIHGNLLPHHSKELISQDANLDRATVPNSFKMNIPGQQEISNLTKTILRRTQEGQNIPLEDLSNSRHLNVEDRQNPPMDSSSQDKKSKNTSFGYSLLSQRLFLMDDKLNSKIELNHVSLTSTHRPKRSINFRLLATKPENPPRYLRKYHTSYPSGQVGSPRWAPHFNQRAIQELRGNLRRYLKRYQRNNYVDLSERRNLVGKGFRRNFSSWQRYDESDPVSSPDWSSSFNTQPRDLHWQTKPKEWQKGFDPHTAQELNLPRTDQLLRLPRKLLVIKKPLYMPKERLRRAINFKNLEEPKRRRFSKREEEPSPPQSFLTPSSFINLLGAPLKAVNHIHALGSQVAPIFKSSTKFMMDFFKIFGRHATRYGNTFKRNIRMTKRLPRRRLRRDLIKEELRRSLYEDGKEATTPSTDEDFLGNDEDPQEFLRHTTTDPTAWIDGLESDEDSSPMVEMLKGGRHKRSTNEELSVQIRAIKDRMVQIGSYIKLMREYDVNKDVPIFQKLEELQDLKDTLFDASKGLNLCDSRTDDLKEASLKAKPEVFGSHSPNKDAQVLTPRQVLNQPDTSRNDLIDKIIETKVSVFKQIIHKLEHDPLHQGLWVKILLRLQKLHCAVATCDRDFLRNLTLVPFVAPGGILPELQRRKDLEVKTQLGLLKGLKEVLGDKDVRERAKAVWEVANVEKLQRAAIAELQRKASAGLQVRRELQIIFDLQKQLDEYQRRKELDAPQITKYN